MGMLIEGCCVDGSSNVETKKCGGERREKRGGGKVVGLEIRGG
jgi:hypothetical protein